MWTRFRLYPSRFGWHDNLRISNLKNRLYLRFLQEKHNLILENILFINDSRDIPQLLERLRMILMNFLKDLFLQPKRIHFLQNIPRGVIEINSIKLTMKFQYNSEGQKFISDFDFWKVWKYHFSNLQMFHL